jgi:hypothetical protein
VATVKHAVEAVVETAGRVTRAAMQKGAAKAALSRPRAARSTRAKTQKFKLDDDDDDEEDEPEPPTKRRAVAPKAEVKREVTPERLAVPVIKVVPSSPAQGEEQQDEEMAREVDLSASAANADADMADATTEAAPVPEEEAPAEAALRVLTPVAAFSEFTLWTPDAPLAGFRPDELTMKEEMGGEGEGEQAPRVWWRRGGAGEGGDEFVRALGEWIGLNEIVCSQCAWERG